MTTYVVPMSRARAAVVGTLNLVVCLALLVTMVVSVAGSGPAPGMGWWAAVALWTAVVVAIFAWNHRTVRRRCYLVRRPALLGAPAGAYPVRPKGERR